VDESLDYVLISNEILPFGFVYQPKVNKEKNETFHVMLAVSDAGFVVALKKKEKIKIIWHGNCTVVSKSLGADKKLDLGDFQIDFPQDIDIILKSRKYSKKRILKILHQYLNFIFRYYKFVLPDDRKHRNSISSLILTLLTFVGFFLGYPIILALPLFLETHLIFLYLLWKHPLYIFYTSFFAALACTIHEIHFKTQNITEENWLFPHFKAWGRETKHTVGHIFVMWGFINIVVAIYWGLYFELLFNLHMS
jgi:hypothetical protein